MRFRKNLEKLKKQGNYRSLAQTQAQIDFCSNDYLGFAHCPQLHARIRSEFEHLTPPYTGSTGSRLLSGNSPLAEQLEKEVAAYHQAEAGVLYNSGYVANVGLLSAVMTKNDRCLCDAHIHASSHDGVRLSGAKRLLWRHNDIVDLEQKLAHHTIKGQTFVLIESVYSCDGSIAPLAAIADLCERFQAYLIVDEAHATGIIGGQGEGLVCAFGRQHQVFARIHTFSKALGAFGAIVLGSERLKEYLVNHSRALIYTTMLPPSVLIAVRSAYQSLPQASLERAKLKHLISAFKYAIVKTALTSIASVTPIQSILIPGCSNARLMAQRLQVCGFDVRALTPPTVKPGTERIRLCLHAYNTLQEIEKLINQMTEQR